MKIAIIITCGLLNDSIYEIDRFKRLMICVKRINDIYKENNDIDVIYAEFGKSPKLEKTLRNKFNKMKYIFLENEGSFNQVELWKKSIKDYPDYDFYGFLHSDIYLSSNFFDKLKERIIDKNTNYYACRLHYYNIFDYKKFQDIKEIDKEKEIYADYDFNYILDKNNKLYNNTMKYKTYNLFEISNEVRQIPSAFICLSKNSIDLINLERIISYHNDVMIRDFSIMLNINYEWLNNDIIFLHLNGLDDLLKTMEKDYETTKLIIKTYPELSFYGMFRFHPQNIPYMNNLKEIKKNIYENYVKNKTNSPYQTEMETWVYEMS